MSRISLATDVRTRAGAPDKDARMKNAYIELRGDQSAARKRPSAQGGIVIAPGVPQGGSGLVVFWNDTPYLLTGGTGTTWNGGTGYNIGDHVTIDFTDYWATAPNTGSMPPSANWSRNYVPPIPAPPITYATWNQADQVGGTLSGGNLTFFTSQGTVRANQGKSTGKWYWEYNVTANNSYDGTTLQTFGIANLSAFMGNEVGNDANGWGYGNDHITVTGIKRNAGNSVAYGGNLPSTLPATFNIGVALDMNAKNIIFYLNGASQGIAYSGLTGTLYPSVGGQSQVGGNMTVIANFGATAFAYSVPSGYNAGLYI